MTRQINKTQTPELQGFQDILDEFYIMFVIRRPETLTAQGPDPAGNVADLSQRGSGPKILASPKSKIFSYKKLCALLSFAHYLRQIRPNLIAWEILNGEVSSFAS